MPQGNSRLPELTGGPPRNEGTAVNKATLTGVGDANQQAGLALVPYPLWCAFATLLSTRIWQLNR
ncbi:tryptophan-rich sensory protein [Mycobacterium kyorinense]|uniref:tryptophan-rich sensory protein n=1 Tax=Mycobacterium kyorinense TaxID=487514 RepID=UPI003D15F512